MKQIVFLCDTNDADYVQLRYTITDEELAELLPIIKIVKDVSNEEKAAGRRSFNNWCVSEYCDDNKLPSVVYNGLLTNEQIEILYDYVYADVHTINKIELLHIEKIDNLL